MLTKRFILGKCLLLPVLVATLSAAAAWGAPEPTLRDLFWKRSWAEMNRLYTSMNKKTPRDHALMANALRFQNKWPDAVALLEAHGKEFPASVRPCADMTLLLGYEKMGRNQEALALADRLRKSAPGDLKYYVAYAQYRLLAKGQDVNKTAAALNRMLESAGTKERRIFALSRLIALPGNRADQALKLLELQPSDKAAAALLAKQKTPWSNSVRVALGVYSHLAGDSAAAEERLRPVPLTASGGRKAAYYRAWSLYRLKRYAEALNLWGRLALSGNAWAESSVRRIATLADKAERQAAISVLERVISGRKGKVQARALLALSGLLDKSQAKRKEALEAQILQAYPDTTYAFDVLWKRGWKNIQAGNAAEAAKLWKQADAPGISALRRPRLLYWLAYAQRAAGNNAAAEKTQAVLYKKYPLSIYSLLNKNRKLNIVNGENPSLAMKPTELEEWGFILYAKLKLSAPEASTRSLYRALKLSRWLGLEESYSEARRLETLLTTGNTLYRSDLEALYPRPFKAQVDAACAEYGVEPAFVWAIMRQESAFNPNARSSAGAAGLMQLMPGTAKDESKRAGLAKYNIMDVNDNIRLGTSHLSWLARSFERKEWIMAAYNAGGGNARKWMKNGGDKLALDRWIEAVRFEETCGYVQRVSANLEIYRLLYGRTTPATAKKPAAK